MFATVGILLALSLNKLSLVEGLVDTFKAIFGREHPVRRTPVAALVAVLR